MYRRDVLKLAAVAAAEPGWKPALFNSHQNATVIVLTELIIPATDTPGAKAALVNRYLDKILKDGPAEERERFLNGLAWLDRYSAETSGQPFVRLAPEAQVKVLETLDTGASAPAIGRSFFRRVKRMTSSIYYATQIGFQELNKGGRVPQTFACGTDRQTAHRM
jgi:hypothetical protein